MAVQRFYGPVNSQSKEAIQIYGATKTLTGGGGSVDSTGVGNIIAFYAQTFYDLLTGGLTGYEDVLESSRTLLGISVTAGASSYTASLLFTDGTSKDILASGSTTLTNQDLYTWGISVPPTPTTTGDDTITLTPTYSSYHTNEVIKMYGSVNGVTKLCYLKMLGRVVYYTDSGNTQTATVRLYSMNDVDQLCHSEDSWNATIDGVTIANTKIKEVQLYDGVTQINLGFCYGCTELTDVTLPDTVTYIGQHFLDNCHKFNSPLNLSNVEFIGGYFMHECDDFNQPLTIPSSVQTIGEYFMYRCNSLVETIIVDCPATVIASDTHTLSTLVMSVPGFRTGHTLAGTYAQDWVTKFPNRSTVPYRKLSVDGTREWGEVYYYTGTTTTYTITENLSWLTINFVNTTALGDFITNNNIDTTQNITIQRMGSSATWKFPTSGNTVNVTSANLLSTTGIDATTSTGFGSGTASFSTQTAPDPSSAIASAKLLNTNEYFSLCGTQGASADSVVPPSSCTVNGMTIDSQAIEGFRFGGLEPPSVPDMFLAMCGNLEWVEMRNSVGSSIGNYFLYGCTSLTSVADIPSTVSSIGSNFLDGCRAFNQQLDIPSTVTIINDYFLYQCIAFNGSLTLPAGVTSIGSYFLSGCSAFNQQLTLPSSITSIGSYFLSDCSSFTYQITLPNISSIETRFMSGCTLFNQPISIPSTVSTIKSYFMAECRNFNSSVSMASSLTSIGSYFLYNCKNFNQSCTPPPNVTKISAGFLMGCSKFNQPLALNYGVTEIGAYFLSGCSAFNQQFNIPSSVTFIRYGFLEYCSNFNQNITIPSSVTSAGYMFYGCNKMVSIIYCEAPETAGGNYSEMFATASTSTAAYTEGMKLSGTYKNEWHDKFPDQNMIIGSKACYRKTIVV